MDVYVISVCTAEKSQSVQIYIMVYTCIIIPPTEEVPERVVLPRGQLVAVA